MPVPSCPGWTVARLLGHLGAIYISIAKNIRVGQGEDVVNELEDLELSPAFEQWFRQGRTAETAPPTVVDWYQKTATDLETVFRSAEPGEATWTWWPSNRTVGFWMRRMAQETAVHRWDAQLAHGQPQPIARELAADLLLFLWHRIPADRLQISGDRSLVERYFELVPPD